MFGPAGPSFWFKVSLALIAGIVIAGTSAKLTYDYCEGQHAREENGELKVMIKMGQQLRSGATELAKLRAQRETVQKAKDIQIAKDTARYEQDTPVAQRVVLPGTWRVRHDAAATGQPATSGSLTDGASDPVTDAEAIDTITDNYASCRADKRRLEDFQAHWRLIEATGCAAPLDHDHPKTED